MARSLPLFSIATHGARLQNSRRRQRTVGHHRVSIYLCGPRYEIICVEGGVEALHHLDANSDRFDVIIVDQKMPKLTGIELVREIRNRNVGGKIIVVSANLTSEICEDYQRMDVTVMFPKPFDVDQLRSAVDRLAA